MYVAGLKKFTTSGEGSGLKTLSGRLSMNSAGSLRFELGRGGGERTFSLDLDRLSRTVLGSVVSKDDSKGCAKKCRDVLAEDCGRELSIPVSTLEGVGVF